MGFLLAAAAEKGIDSTPIEGLDTAKLDEILGLREKGMRSVAVVTLGYRSPNDGNAQRPKSRLALDRIVTEFPAGSPGLEPREECGLSKFF